MADDKFFRSKTFTTEPVVAVYPRLTKPDNYKKYGIEVDMAVSPGLRAALVEQAEEFLKEAHSVLETTKKPTNSLFRIGKDQDTGEPFERAAFRMASENSKGIPQRPLVVDSKRQPMTSMVFGGSTVKVGYHFQYSIFNGKCSVSLKLDAVQVIEHVGPGGELSADKFFDDEDGFVESAAGDAIAGDQDENGGDY